MAVNLRRLLTQKRRLVSELLLEASLAMQTGICVQDVGGAVLLGDLPYADYQQYAIQSGGETIGWVLGGNGSQALARWLAYLCDQAAEIDALADEALHRYREVNLLYNLSGKLTASLEPKYVCTLALDETRRLIQSSAGGIMLMDSLGLTLDLAAGFGLLPAKVTLGEGLIGACAQTSKAELVNGISADPRHYPAESAFGALLCAPLETHGHLLGILVLANDSPDSYTAGDLKLLSTMASQSAPIIENALMHEKMLQEALAREALLEQQIQALRIELDESRQAKKVAEITESDYFKNLLQQADDLRQIVEDT
jgi:GAF domain-containing protein